MKVILLALLVLGPALFIPSFAQSEPTTGFETTYIGSNNELYDSDGKEIIYQKLWNVSETSNVIQVDMVDGKMVFDKMTGAVTIFNKNEIKVKSDSFVIRGSPVNTDSWFNLLVNNEPVTYTIQETEQYAVITFTKTNNEGIFNLETKVHNEFSKTTAYFTNYQYEDHKFAFTETVELPDNKISLNAEEIDLSVYSGLSFTRDVLEQNMDMIIKAGELGYHSGIGFESLWQVNIHENNMISLDYANVGELVTPIGETMELDPTWVMTIGVVGVTSTANNHFYTPYGNAIDSSGNVWVVDGGINNRIQKFDSSGTYLSTIGTPGVSGTSNSHFNYPYGMALDSSGNIYVADEKNDRVQKFNSSGTYLLTISGLNKPKDVAVDSSNNVFVTDTNNQQVLKFDSSGTLLSTFVSGYGTANGQVISPWGIGIDSSDNVYITSLQNDRIQKFNSSGTWLMTLGITGSPGSANNQFNNPYGVDIDSSGNIYVADTGNNRIQKLDSSGNHLWTIGGSYGTSNNQFSQPSYVTIDGIDIWVSDQWNYRVQKYVDATVPSAITNLTAIFNNPNVDLSWTAPSHGGISITGYKIEHSIDDITYNTLIADTGNTNTTYSHTAPTLGSTNYYKVYAINSLGTGATSNTASALAGVPPDPPTSLSSSIPNNATAPLDIVLTWTLPGNTGTASLSDIKIERSTNNTTWTPLTTLFTGSGSSVSFTDQVGTPGQYYYRVYAVSPHGTSTASNDTNSITSDVPDAPVLSGSVVSDTQIDLSWTTPNSSSDLINYRLTQNGVDILQPSVGTNSHSVTGLTPGGTYDFIVYAKNYAGDSVGSNTIQLTTHISVTGTFTATVNQIGATLEIIPSFTLTNGTPVPTFSNVYVYENNVLIQTEPYGTFYYHLEDGNAHTLELRINDPNHWNTPSFTHSFTATSTYEPNWDSNNVSHDITRANNLFNRIVNWATTIPFDMTCEYKTSTQAIDKTAGISSTGTGLWAFQDSGVAINDGTHVYGECTSNNQTVLTFTSYGPNLILAGAGLLNQHSGDFLGVPAVMIFIIAVAGLFTGRSANTGILVILSVIGIAGFLGFMIIDQATWGFILIAGVLGLFVGRRFL